MLTDTQLRTARTGELERLKARVEAELAEREQSRDEEEHRPGDEPEEPAEVGEETSPSGTYRWEMVECGHKDRCKKCKGGQKHGPYLYRYLRKDGKYTSEYVKLSEAKELGFERPTPASPV